MGIGDGEARRRRRNAQLGQQIERRAASPQRIGQALLESGKRDQRVQSHCPVEPSAQTRPSVQRAPERSAFSMSAPWVRAPDRSAPRRLARNRWVRLRSAFFRLAPDRSALVKSASAKLPPASLALCRMALMNLAWVALAPVRSEEERSAHSKLASDSRACLRL